MPFSVFITSTGTSSGKTFLTRGLAASLRARRLTVAALKPLETGCAPDAADAIALAHAAGNPELARAPGLHRGQAAVAPYAATLLGETAPDFHAIVQTVRELTRATDIAIIEGAGGLLVPIDADHDVADLARALALPLVIAAPNRLGVISYLRTACESAARRDLRVAALVLTEPDTDPDASTSTNARILRERLDLPVVSFPHCPDDDSALAAAVEASGLLPLLD